MFITKLTVMGEHDQAYEITAHPDGVVHCTCPAWKFDPAPQPLRRCKHIKFVENVMAR